jgi:long-chain acyl-CoA synthetase
MGEMVNEAQQQAARNARVWVFDVDATLLDGMSATSLRPYAYDLLTLLADRNNRLVLWSAGGAEYAQRRLEAVDAFHFFDAVHSKGDRLGSGFYDVTAVLRNSESLKETVFVDDQPSDLPPSATVLAVRPYLAPNRHDNGLVAIISLLSTTTTTGPMT